MVRMEVRLTDEQAELLRRVATARGVPMAALVREAVEVWATGSRGLSSEEKRRRAIAAIGIVKGGPADMAARHDDYFADSILP